MERWTQGVYRRTGVASASATEIGRLRQEIRRAEGTAFLTLVALGGVGTVYLASEPSPVRFLVAAILGGAAGRAAVRRLFAGYRDLREGRVELYERDLDAVFVDEAMTEPIEDEEESAARREFSPPARRVWPRSGWSAVENEASWFDDQRDLAAVPPAPREVLTEEEIEEVRRRLRWATPERALALVVWLAIAAAPATVAGLAVAETFGLIVGFLTLAFFYHSWQTHLRDARSRAVVLRDPRVTLDGVSERTADGRVWSHRGVPARWRRWGYGEDAETAIPSPYGEGI